MRYAELPLIDLHASLRTRALRFFWKGRTHSYAKYALSRRIYHRTRHAWAGRRLLQFNVPQRYATALTAVSPAAGALLPHLYPRREEIAWARNMLKDKGFRGTNVRPVALHPYATHRNKEWPTSHWQELTRLLDARDIPWLVIGKNDSPAKWAASERNLTNQTTLRQSCAVLASCSRLVTGDSGPMHLACGVGTPVVALFGPTTRAWGFYPEGPKDVVLESGLQCRPCSLHGGKNCQRDRECMRTIHPQDVADSLAYD